MISEETLGETNKIRLQSADVFVTTRVMEPRTQLFEQIELCKYHSRLAPSQAPSSCH